MTINTKTIEVWVAIDSDGDYDAAHDPDIAIERLEECGINHPLRLIKISATLALPQVAEVSVAVPDEAGEVIPEVEP